METLVENIIDLSAFKEARELNELFLEINNRKGEDFYESILEKKLEDLVTN